MHKQAAHGPDQLTMLNLNFKEPSLAEVLRLSFLTFINLCAEDGKLYDYAFDDSVETSVKYENRKNAKSVLA